MLGTADRETATWCSDTVGHREVREVEENQSYGHNSARDAVSLTARREIAPLLLPDEFMGLKSLEGYIKFPEGLPTAPVTLEPRDWPRIAEGFIPRAIQRPARTVAKPVNVGPDEGEASGQRGSDSDDSGERRRRDDKHPGRDADGDQRKRPNRKSQRRHAKDRSKEAAPDDQTGAARDRQSAAEAANKERLPVDQSTGRQSELPLEPGSRKVPNDHSADRSERSGDSPHPHRAKESKEQRTHADHERRQRDLLGGAAHDNERDKPDRDEPDVGDIEPDI